MSSESTDVKSIFGQAFEIESSSERARFLAEACADNPALRAEVEDLLRVMADARSFMQRAPALASSTPPYEPISEGPGTKIGPYKLLQQIG